MLLSVKSDFKLGLFDLNSIDIDYWNMLPMIKMMIMIITITVIIIADIY